jgi:hypothetical protein
LAPANAAGFGAFEQALSSGLFSSAVAVKGQIEGPITLSAYLFHKSRPFLSDPTLFSAVAFHVSQILGRQIDRLKSAGLPVLLFVDEPALCLDAPVANAVDSASILIRWLKAVSLAGDPQKFAQRAMITATCRTWTPGYALRRGILQRRAQPKQIGQIPNWFARPMRLSR